MMHVKNNVVRKNPAVMTCHDVNCFQYIFTIMLQPNQSWAGDSKKR